MEKPAVRQSIKMLKNVMNGVRCAQCSHENKDPRFWPPTALRIKRMRRKFRPFGRKREIWACFEGNSGWKSLGPPGLCVLASQTIEGLPSQAAFSLWLSI